jgi:hypothetical protein
MHDNIECRGRMLAYRRFREDHPTASHEESLTFAARCWREFQDRINSIGYDDEPERLVALDW